MRTNPVGGFVVLLGQIALSQSVREAALLILTKLSWAELSILVLYQVSSSSKIAGQASSTVEEVSIFQVLSHVSWSQSLT